MKLAKIGLVIITSLALMFSVCLTVQANEESGSVDLSATVDLVISDVSASGIGYYDATISWKTNGDATSRVFYDTEFHDDIADYADNTIEDTALVSEHSIPLTGLSSGRTYHYRVRSAAVIDGSDFIAISEDYTFSTLTPAGGGGWYIPPDTTPPIISDIYSRGVTETTASIYWTTNEPGTSQVEYRTSPGVLSPLDEAYVTAHRVKLVRLSPGITYYYKAMSKDAAGNLAVSDEYTFTTLEVVVEPEEPTEPIEPIEPEPVIEPEEEEPEVVEPEVIEPEEEEEPYVPSEEVTEEVTEEVPAKPFPWPLVGGIIAAAVVVGLLVFFLIRRKNKKKAH